MADEVPQDNQNAEPTESKEVKGHLLSAEEATDWGNNTRIVEPAAKTEDGKTIDGTEAPEEDKPEEDEETPNTEETTETNAPIEEEPVITATDPGDFAPKDYSFEITVYDSEGKNGKPQTIKSLEQWDELLEKDPNLGSAAALAKGLRLAAKMESNLERDKADYDKAKLKFDNQKKSEEARISATTNMINEINYLVESKDLPAVDPKYKDGNWADPEVAKQPGIKEQIALLTFMRDENNRRKRLNLKPMTSVLDAFNAYERANAKTISIDRKKIEGQQRKAAGAVVAPASPSPNTVAPKGIKVGRGGSLQDLSFNGW